MYFDHFHELKIFTKNQTLFTHSGTFNVINKEKRVYSTINGSYPDKK